MEADIYAPRSIAEIILSERMHPLRRWALKKLIPTNLWEAPPQVIGKLAKGSIICRVRIDTTTQLVGLNPPSISVGVARE